MTKYDKTIMKVKNLLALIIFCFVIVVSSSKAQETLPDLVTRIKPSVVSIVTYDKDGKKVASGSGFCIATDRIITNKHVIDGASRIVVHITNGDVYRVTKIDSVDKEGDLALLQTEQLASQIKPLTVAKFPPRAGEKVFVVGNPLGLEGSVSDGIVAAFRNIRGIGKLIQITAPISSGSSGSPVINIWGEVIGVATLNLEGGQNLNFAISSERIVSLWASQLTISNNTYPNLPMASITEEQRLKAEQLYIKGEALHRNKDVDKALSYYLEAIQINPNYAVAHLGAGYCRYELRQYREAIENFKQVIRIYPKESNMLFLAYDSLSYIYHELKQYEDAVEVSKQAIRLDSNSYSVFNNLGLSYYALKQYRDAVSCFQKAILNSNKSSDKINAIYNLGMAYLALGDKNSALEQQKLLANLDSEKAKQLLSMLTNISGYWKVSDSLTYKIVDDGYKVTVQFYTYFTELTDLFEAKWEGNLAIGTSSKWKKEIYVIRQVDSNHLIFNSYRGNIKEPIEKILKKAKEKIEKGSILRKIE